MGDTMAMGTTWMEDTMGTQPGHGDSLNGGHHGGHSLGTVHDTMGESTTQGQNLGGGDYGGHSLAMGGTIWPHPWQGWLVWAAGG